MSSTGTPTSGTEAPGSIDPRRARVVRTLALIVGAVFTAVGIAGFLVTGFEYGFTEETHQELLVFEVNPLHNTVHLALGVLGLLMGWSVRSARAYGWILAVAYGAVLIYGFMVVDRTSGDVLSLNWADNWLHLGTVVVGLIIALLPVRRRVPTDAQTTTATATQRPLR